MEFEYDAAKNEENIRKHGVSFEEALTVFGDPLLLLSVNETEVEEERFVALGRSAMGRDLFVVHCYRVNEGTDHEKIRIISARKLTPREKRRVERLRL